MKRKRTKGGSIFEVKDFFKLKNVLAVPGGKELIQRLQRLERRPKANRTN